MVAPASASAGVSCRRLRCAVEAHWETWRPYTLAYPGLVGLAGAAAGGSSTPSTLALAAAWACPTLCWLGGHYLGDYFDRELDALGKPQRPIPSGRLSPAAACTCGVLAVSAGGLLALVVSWPTVMGVLLALAGIIAYSRLLKGRGLWGNLARGALTALAVLFGAAVVAPLGELPSWHALPVSAAFLLHDAASNLVGTMRDVDGDRAGGYHTVSVQRGPLVATRTAAILFSAAMLMAAAAAACADHLMAYLVVLLCAVAVGMKAFCMLLGSSRRPLDAQRALDAHEVLVGERLMLAGAVLAGRWGLPMGLAAVLPLLAVSLVAQHRTRAAFEFPRQQPYTPPPGGVLDVGRRKRVMQRAVRLQLAVAPRSEEQVSPPLGLDRLSRQPGPSADAGRQGRTA